MSNPLLHHPIPPSTPTAPPPAGSSSPASPSPSFLHPSADSSPSRLLGRRSVEDLRLPPGYRGSVSPEVQRRTSLGSSHAVILGDEEEVGRGRKRGETPTVWPASPALLRRCSSAQDLLLREEEGEGDAFIGDEQPYRLRSSSIASSITSTRSWRGVRIEDHSDRVSNAFASDVRITGFFPVGERASGFVVYDCEITTREGTVIRTLKRYSAFCSLRTDLITSFPRLKPLIPNLPPKSSFAKFRPSFLEKRRIQLSYWLATVLLQPELGGSGVARDFVSSA